MPAFLPDVQEATVEVRTFAPLEVDKMVDVQPVLTPDNYIDVVLPFIESAKSKIYLQNQYINESLDERATDTYVALVRAIAAKQQEGLDVRIILRATTAWRSVISSS
jgi:phosphatidylserine/phosphatidylglycerophosphate/cardiolipin synthase-like enzyme